MTEDVVLIAEIRSRLSDHRYRHSMCVAECAAALSRRYGWDPAEAYTAGIVHDVLKEQEKAQTLAFFEEQGVELTPVERACPKLWHAMAGALYLKKAFDLPRDVLLAVRYHTTGRENMTLPEKILFTADFISEDRDYPGVDDMRRRAGVSLENAMEEGLRFTIEELSAKCRPIHPDTLAAYNQILTGNYNSEFGNRNSE